jgi:hypothetical protein
MARPNALRALPPTWFRFTDEEDQGKYGTRWYVYDESTIMRKRGRDLVALETDLGMPLVNAMNGFRGSTSLGDLAVTWIGIYLVDPARAGDFNEYNPLTTMIEWTPVNPEPEGKDQTPAPESDSSPSSNTILEKTDTVVLPVSPLAE